MTSWTQSDIAKLEKAIASGARRVRFQTHEVEYQSTQDMLDALGPVRVQCATLGLVGTARAIRWRELVRCLDIDTPEAATRARAMADELAPHVGTGLSAKCYPPEVWWTLARAYERAGESTRGAEALAVARRWIAGALPTVPAEHRSTFEQRNRVNRLLLAAS